MRLLAALVLALAPSVAATSPEPPWTVHAGLDGEPAVRRPVTLKIDLHANTGVEPEGLALSVPPFVDATALDAWPAFLEPGGTATRSWRLTAREAGLWTIGLHDANASMGWCCLFVHSRAERGAWATEAAGLSIQAKGDPHLAVVTVDASTIRLTYTLPRGDWLPQTRPVVAINDLSAAEPALPGEAAVATRDVPLASGNSTVATRYAAARSDFAGGDDLAPASWTTDIECVNMELTREGDRVRVANEWSCFADERRSIPLAGLVGLAALALAARAAQRLSRPPP